MECWNPSTKGRIDIQRGRSQSWQWLEEEYETKRWMSLTVEGVIDGQVDTV